MNLKKTASKFISNVFTVVCKKTTLPQMDSQNLCVLPTCLKFEKKETQSTNYLKGNFNPFILFKATQTQFL